MKYKCTTCGGIYDDTSSDGVPYFHACSPVLDKNKNYIERTDKRDENVGKKLEGLGRTKAL